MSVSFTSPYSNSKYSTDEFKADLHTHVLEQHHDKLETAVKVMAARAAVKIVKKVLADASNCAETSIKEAADIIFKGPFEDINDTDSTVVAACNLVSAVLPTFTMSAHAESRVLGIAAGRAINAVKAVYATDIAKIDIDFDADADFNKASLVTFCAHALVTAIRAAAAAADDTTAN